MEESGTTGEGRRLAAHWQGLIACAASAVLYTLSFPPFNVAETAYVFAVPLLLWGLFGSACRREWPMLVAAGWLAWLVLIVWLRNCTQVLETPFAAALGWLVTLALALVLGLFWAAWCGAALFTVRLARSWPPLLRLLAVLGLPALWVVLEWLRGILFSGLPWLPLAASQWQRPLLLQVASATGAAGVSFVLVAFSLGLAFYFHVLWHNRRKGWLRRLSFEFYLALLLLMAAVGYGVQAAGTGHRGRIEGPRLGFVQPDVGVSQKWDPERMRENLATLRDLTTYAGFLGAELVLWPESPTPLPVKGNASMQEWVEQLSRETGLPLLIGNIAREGGPDDPGRRWYNAVFYVDPQTGVDTTNYYAKRRLVPFGEYVPLAGWLPFIRKLVPVEGEFHPGTLAVPLRPSAGNGMGRVGNLVCYEDIFPQLARANVLAGADWHYVATNNVWFGREAAAEQHAAHSVLRAVETRRPVVRCGNAGWSGWIDEYGHIRHVMRDDKGSIYFQGVEAVEFSRSAWWADRLSPYVRMGDWFTAVCAALAAVTGLSLLLRERGLWRRSASG